MDEPQNAEITQAADDGQEEVTSIEPVQTEAETRALCG